MLALLLGSLSGCPLSSRCQWRGCLWLRSTFYCLRSAHWWRIPLGPFLLTRRFLRAKGDHTKSRSQMHVHLCQSQSKTAINSGGVSSFFCLFSEMTVGVLLAHIEHNSHLLRHSVGAVKPLRLIKYHTNKQFNSSAYPLSTKLLFSSTSNTYFDTGQPLYFLHNF